MRSGYRFVYDTRTIDPEPLTPHKKLQRATSAQEARPDNNEEVSHNFRLRH